MITFGQVTPKAIERIKEQRRLAYAKVSDPIFFKWQRGEATEDEYLTSVTQVKLDHPYPEGYTDEG